MRGPAGPAIDRPSEPFSLRQPRGLAHSEVLEPSEGNMMTLFVGGVLAVTALWLIAGILRDEHRKTRREMREISQLDRDFARVIRQSRPKRH